MIYFVQADGSIKSAVAGATPDSLSGITRVPDGCTAMFFDDIEYADLAANYGIYRITDGVPVAQPHLTLAYANSVLTATLNNAPSTPPASVTFTIAGTAFSVPLTNGAASLAVNVHKVVAAQSHAITASADGCLGASISIGGAVPASTFVVATHQADGSVLIKSTSRAEITAYYMAHNVAMSDMLTDIANWVDLLSSMTLKLAATAPAGTFTAAESTALTDINANLAPKLRLTLADAILDGSNPRYTQIVAQKEQANTNADEYLEVVADPDVK